MDDRSVIAPQGASDNVTLWGNLSRAWLQPAEKVPPKQEPEDRE